MLQQFVPLPFDVPFNRTHRLEVNEPKIGPTVSATAPAFLPLRPLHTPLGSSRVITALAVSHLVVRISFLTPDLCAIAAVCVQLKAVVENGPLYMVFYYLTRPPFAVKVGETLRC